MEVGYQDNQVIGATAAVAV